MKKKESVVNVSFVLDETGSMQSVKGQTISGFNEYIETLRKDKTAKNMRFTLTKFNSGKMEVKHSGVKLEDVELLTDANYQPNECTPLYDAIGRTINNLGMVDKALVIIQTDGQENASREYDRSKIFDLISSKKKFGWTFAFLGADQDAWAASGAIGISKGNTISYASADTTKTIGMAAVATCAYSRTGGASTVDFWDDGNKLKKEKKV